LLLRFCELWVALEVAFVEPIAQAAGGDGGDYADRADVPWL